MKKSRTYLLSALLATSLMGCTKKETTPPLKSSASAYNILERANKDERISIFLAPVINSSGEEFPWDLSQEFTAQIANELLQGGKFHLVREGRKEHLNLKNNPFGSDITWMKNSYNSAEFVCFVEILQHEENANKTRPIMNSASEVLELTARLRVVDLRGQAPKLVLQEVFKQSQFVPEQYTSDKFKAPAPELIHFSMSPVGIAHQKISREIAKRTRDYILLATSGG